MFKFKLLVTFIALSCLFLGCAKKTQLPSPTPLCLSGIDIASAMQTAEEALVAMNFHIEKSDAQFGLIRTEPLEGSQFFELWRKDNADAYKAALANLHSIRRIVELNFKNETGNLCIDCSVMLSRLSLPEKEINSTTKTYSMFSQSSESRQTLRIEPEQEAMMEWIDLGRDANLETVILKKIQKQLSAKKDKKL